MEFLYLKACLLWVVCLRIGRCQLIHANLPADLWPSHWLFPSSHCLLSQTQSAAPGSSPTATAGLANEPSYLGALCKLDLFQMCAQPQPHTLWAWELTLWAHIVLLNWETVCLCLPISRQPEGRTCPYSSQGHGELICSSWGALHWFPSLMD